MNIRLMFLQWILNTYEIRGLENIKFHSKTPEKVTRYGNILAHAPPQMTVQRMWKMIDIFKNYSE